MKQLLIVVSKAFASLQYSRTREMEKKKTTTNFCLSFFSNLMKCQHVFKFLSMVFHYITRSLDLSEWASELSYLKDCVYQI